MSCKLTMWFSDHAGAIKMCVSMGSPDLLRGAPGNLGRGEPLDTAAHAGGTGLPRPRALYEKRRVSGKHG
jgi:hypothetical protein